MGTSRCCTISGTWFAAAAAAAVVDTASVGRQFDTRGRKGEINTKDRD